MDRKDACQRRARTCKVVEPGHSTGGVVVTPLDEIDERGVGG